MLGYTPFEGDMEMLNQEKVDYRQIDEEIKSYVESGKYKVVDLSLFKSLDHFTMDDAIVGEYEFTIDLYRNYLNILQQLEPKLRTVFLSTLKSADIMDNQSLEKEDSFLLSLYRQVQKNYAIDYLIREMKKYNRITPDILKNTHGILLEGTSGANCDNYQFRSNNRKFVGTVTGNQRNIAYFPIRQEQIEEAVNILCECQNSKEYSNHDDLVKPIILHGLIATLQLFDDGNTRMARLMQHVSIYEATCKNQKDIFDKPTLYATRTYFPYRGIYRSMITNLAINPDKEAWNSWIKFNLRRIQDQIFVNEERVKKVKVY